GPHEVQIKVEVVDGVQPRAKNLVATVEVAEIRPCVVPAGVARAAGIDGRQVGLVSAVADVDDPGRREKMAVPRMPGRHHTIEHIDSSEHRRNNVLGTPDAHQIAGPLGRHLGDNGLQNAQSLLLGLTYGQSAYSETREVELHQCLKRSQPQGDVHTALNDAEQTARWRLRL